MRRRVARPLAVLVGAVIAVWSSGVALAAPGSEVVCRFDPAYREVSGLAASTQHPGVLWLHEDSGSGPSLHAIDARTCATVATLRISGARARDFEAVGMGTMPDGAPAIWLGDIGDNTDSWPWVEVLRIREPAELADATVRARAFRVTYPDRPHNAETLLVHDDQLWIVTKQLARGALYRLPNPLRRGVVNVAERVQAETGLVTDGAIAPGGSQYVLRDYFDAQIFVGLPPGEPGARVDLPAQRQGEAITFSADGSALYIASEQDRRLVRIPLTEESATPGAAVASASPSVTAAAEPADDPSESALDGSSSVSPWVIALAGAAIVAVFAIAERRRRS